MLAQLQQQFLKALQNKTQQDLFLEHVQVNPKLSASQSFAIYQGSINAMLTRALKETYPVCHKLVGEDFFNGMAHYFIQQTPCQQASLFQYGREFAEFIAHFEPAAKLVYLADVAQFEWVWQQAYYASDTIEFNALLSFNYPIYRIWQVNQTNYDGEQQVELTRQKEYLRIYRKQMQVLVQRLSRCAWQASQTTPTTE